MSIKYVNAVINGPQSLTGSKLLVMISLAEWADENGLSWHCVAELAKRARLKERATQYILQQLAEAGYIYIEEGRGRNHTSRYTVLLDLLAPEIKGAKGASIVAPLYKEEEKVQKVQNTEEKVQRSDIKGAIAIAPEPSLTVIEPSVKRDAPKERALKPVPKSRPLDLPEHFSTKVLWQLMGDTFGALTWSGADYAREAQAVGTILKVVPLATEGDLVRFLRYRQACNAWKIGNSSTMPLLSQEKAQFGAWYHGGRPEQPAPKEQTNGNDKPSRLAGVVGRIKQEHRAELDEIQGFGIQRSREDYQADYTPKRLIPPKSA